MNLNLPMLENQMDNTNALPFTKEFISYVLRKYLIEGEAIINIEQKYFSNGYNNTGILASQVLNAFGLISSTNAFDNKGIYNGTSIEDVFAFLNQQNEKYRKIAAGLAQVQYIPNYTEQELGALLGKIYNNAEENTKILSLYLFGIKFADLIAKNNYNYKNIVEIANIPSSLDVELSKAMKISQYVTINKMPKVIEEKNIVQNDLKEIDNTNRVTGGTNVIYYGAPGCGKSYKVKNICENEGFDYVRTIFYPDYTNGEFVGLVAPKVDKNGKISYEIEPGYFTKILFDALLNPTQKYCLVIEEINRGNASAIFGDVFQLLDRKKDGSSEFEISNDLIKQYFNNKGYKLDNDKVSLPSNLWIIATMNTSDQNVYTLDTAFKRRWKLEKISNKFDENNEYDKTLEAMLIPGSKDVTWKKFIETINEEIFEKNAYGVNAEDKQIGKYFVGPEDLIKNDGTLYDNINDIKKSFAEKVLMYLWDDVAKLNRELWFNPKYKTLDDLLIGFEKENLKVFNDLFITTEEDTNNNE